ncbi:hypothetical protein OEZ85_009314 [Tetradesmus obliquus]|uniref:Uncharacterized protein n=1 Tax=Tetradesmus obliquus TaxID=3088 RepID=A0ABY8U954_TETOB|nr:hypothetical protein OEZ85_009314 [Tetradesmus obliquus]
MRFEEAVYKPFSKLSPESDTGGYWTSQYAPYQVSLGLPGGSPPASIARQHLSRLSLSRHHHHRCSLSAQALLTWLQRHPAVVSGTGRLLLDLSHHSYHDFDRQALEQLLGALPQLASVCLVGAVEGTDAYEPLGRLRCLAALELCCASQACLDGGLLALGFLPRLTSLSVSLDIHPASPAALSELPAGLASLKLGSMWLEGLSAQLGDLTDLTSITLERCQLESNPMPLLLTLPQLAAVTLRNASRPTPNSSEAT